MAAMTKKGARSVTSTLDRIANLFQFDHEALGVPEKYAHDFALRCDMMSAEIEKTAGITKEALDELDVAKEPGFNPEVIGEEVKGPQEGDADEPYMKGEFTQQENRELRNRVQDGDLGMTPNEEPLNPSAGKQASFEQIGRLEANSRVAKAVTALQGAAVRLASAGHKTLAPQVSRLAASLMATQVSILNGTADAGRVARAIQAVTHLLPTLEGLKATGLPKAAEMTALAIKVAKKAEDEEVVEEVVEEKEPEEKKGKKAADDEKKDDADEKEEKEPESKKAHGFTLDA